MNRPQRKYYDWNREAPLDANADGCPFEHWGVLHKNHAFAVHPDGFLVFVPPSLLEPADEYADADPYTVDGFYPVSIQPEPASHLRNADPHTAT